MARALGIDPPTGQGDDVWAEALGTMMRIAGDPDVSIGTWLSEATPVGIEHEIPSHGIFPKLTKADAIRAAKGYTPVDSYGHNFDFRNYTSYEEQIDKADAELERERAAGYLLSGSRESLERLAGGPLKPSRVGVIVKEKGGITKVRLIHDLSRSG